MPQSQINIMPQTLSRGDKIPSDMMINGKSYPAGTPVDLILDDAKGGPALAQQPRQLLAAKPAVDNSEFGSNRVGQEMAKAGLDVALLGTGFLPGGQLPFIAGRTALAGGLGALRGSLDNDAQNEAILQGGMQGVGDLMGGFLPKLGIRAALKIGQAAKDLPSARRYAQAFENQMGRANVQLRSPISAAGKLQSPLTGNLRIPVGNQRRTLDATQRAMNTIKDITSNSPAEVPGEAYLSAGQKVADKASATRSPVDLKHKLVDEEIDFMYQQLSDKYGIPLDRLKANVSIDDARKAMENTTFSMPHSQDYQRSQGIIGDAHTKAIREGTITSPEQNLRGQLGSSASEKVKRAQESADSNLFGPRLKNARSEFSDLKTMQEANTNMRQGFLTNMAIRGAGGATLATLANTIASLGGNTEPNPIMNPLLGGAIGSVGFDPRVMSTMLNILGRAGHAVPQAVRTQTLLNDTLHNKPKKKKVPVK